MLRPHRDSFKTATRRNGNLAWKLLAGLVVVSAAIVLLLFRGSPVSRTRQAQQPPRLLIYAAAGLRGPAEKIAASYETEYGIGVDLQFGGSNTLLNQMQVNKFETADLFLAADDYYTAKAVADGLAAEVLPVAQQRPVIAVRNDSVLQIGSIRDLLAPAIKISVTDPEQAAIGRAVKQALEAVAVDGGTLWSQLAEHVTKNGVFKPTVIDVATDVKLGAVDAGIVWDSTVAASGFRESLKAIPIPEFESIDELVSLAVLTSSRQPTAALRFARYLAASDRGLPVFEESGLRPVAGDDWSVAPELTFFCGAVNRRAVEQIVDKFQQREGVVVNTVYDGCGTLTSRMKTIDGQQTGLGFPDMYMACDRYYLDNVPRLVSGRR